MERFFSISYLHHSHFSLLDLSNLNCFYLFPSPPHFIGPRSLASQSSMRPPQVQHHTLSHLSLSLFSRSAFSSVAHCPGPAQGWSISDDFVFTLSVCSRTCSARGSGGLLTPQAPSPSSQLLVFMHMCPWCAGSSEDHTVWPPHSKASYPPSQGTDFHVTSFLSQGHMCLFNLAYLDCTFLSFSLSFLM